MHTWCSNSFVEVGGADLVRESELKAIILVSKTLNFKYPLDIPYHVSYMAA